MKHTTLLALTLALCASHISAQSPTPDGAQQLANLAQCPLESGELIQDCHIGYRTWGKLNADRSNAVLFPTWFTGVSAELADSIGPGKLVDPSRYFVIAVDALGDGVSSSPSNSKAQPRMAFPAFTIADMVQSQYRLLTETLHIPHLHAVIGISMGGMQTFQWIVDHPDFMDLAVPIVGSTRLTAWDLLLWHAEEDAIRQSPAWQLGNYARTPALPLTAILQDMNLTTPSHYNREVPRDNFAHEYAAYGTEGATEFDANDRIFQLQAMIHHDIAHGASLEDTAKRVHARVLVVVSQQDHMVNPAPAQAFAPLIHAQVITLTSDCGHLATGCEADKLDPQVRAFLDSK